MENSVDTHLSFVMSTYTVHLKVNFVVTSLRTWIYLCPKDPVKSTLDAGEHTATCQLATHTHTVLSDMSPLNRD